MVNGCQYIAMSKSLNCSLLLEGGAGSFQNCYHTDATEYIKFHNQLIEVMNKPIGKFAYTIFASTAYENKFSIGTSKISSMVTMHGIPSLYKVH